LRDAPGTRYKSPVADDTSRQRAASTEELVHAADGAMPHEPGGSVRAAIAEAMVGVKKEFYGRGPNAAKAWVLDDYVFVALEGGLTRNEETLLAAGRHEVVRSYRLAFQETMTATATSAVEQIVGRKVLTYHSQIVFDPVRAFEIFVLEPAGA
jgi:uncharacterized protein YbcI